MKLYDVTWHEVTLTWLFMTWHDPTWYDMTWPMTWPHDQLHDMTRNMTWAFTTQDPPAMTHDTRHITHDTRHTWPITRRDATRHIHHTTRHSHTTKTCKHTPSETITTQQPESPLWWKPQGLATSGASVVPCRSGSSGCDWFSSAVWCHAASSVLRGSWSEAGSLLKCVVLGSMSHDRLLSAPISLLQTVTHLLCRVSLSQADLCVITLVLVFACVSSALCLRAYLYRCVSICKDSLCDFKRSCSLCAFRSYGILLLHVAFRPSFPHELADCDW